MLRSEIIKRSRKNHGMNVANVFIMMVIFPCANWWVRNVISIIDSVFAFAIINIDKKTIHANITTLRKFTSYLLSI